MWVGIRENLLGLFLRMLNLGRVISFAILLLLLLGQIELVGAVDIEKAFAKVQRASGLCLVKFVLFLTRVLSKGNILSFFCLFEHVACSKQS